MTSAPSDYFISTPIYYVNDAPHLGHAYTMINSDVFARWHRGLGERVLYLTGTDEHGQKIADSAAKAGMDVGEWTDSYANKFKETWASLHISYDDFIRTTEERHVIAVKKFLQAVYDNGYIYKGKYEGLYCVSCESYYTATEAVDSNCPVHKRPLTVMEEENYFFKLSAFTEAISNWYEEVSDSVFPDFRKNESAAFVRGGLEDISISRVSLKWGIPLPWDESHVCYVWFDALINYLTAIGYGEGDALFEPRWKNSHHLIGKDIQRFHCVWWPAMVMAAGLTPPRQVLVHGWLLVKGEKMAKSGGNGVDAVSLSETYGVDAVRYYLMREYSLGSDGDFSLEALEQRYNVELANNLGNLLSRVTNIVAKNLGGVTPAFSGKVADSSILQGHIDSFKEHMNGYLTSKALEEIAAMVRYANVLIEESAPWKEKDLGKLSAILGDLLEIIRLAAVCLAPILVISSPRILEAIGIDSAADSGEFVEELVVGRYLGGSKIEKAAPLFPRIEG